MGVSRQTLQTDWLLAFISSASWRCCQIYPDREKSRRLIDRDRQTFDHNLDSRSINRPALLESVALQVVLTAPGHQMVNLPHVGRLIPTRDYPNEGDVVHELQELDRLMTGGAGVRVQGEE